MKGIICYYSGSGNTKLACEKIAREVKGVELSLFNIANGTKPQLEQYDIVGFACFTDFWGVPYLMQNFIEQLQPQKSYAFVFNTYGYVSGKTLRNLEKLVTTKGYTVVLGHSLHAPESYPPMVVRGLGNEKAPSRKGIKDFERFILRLDELFSHIEKGKQIKRRRVAIGLLNSLLPSYPRIKARNDMGEKFLDVSLCDECGICKKLCPYSAIDLNPKPIFDMNKCYGCWACYNHCPNKAIYTKKFRGVGHYPKPNPQFKEKMKN